MAQIMLDVACAFKLFSCKPHSTRERALAVPT